MNISLFFILFICYISISLFFQAFMIALKLNMLWYLYIYKRNRIYLLEWRIICLSLVPLLLHSRENFHSKSDTDVGFIAPSACNPWCDLRPAYHFLTIRMIIITNCEDTLLRIIYSTSMITILCLRFVQCIMYRLFFNCCNAHRTWSDNARVECVIMSLFGIIVMWMFVSQDKERNSLSFPGWLFKFL